MVGQCKHVDLELRRQKDERLVGKAHYELLSWTSNKCQGSDEGFGGRTVVQCGLVE